MPGSYRLSPPRSGFMLLLALLGAATLSLVVALAATHTASRAGDESVYTVAAIRVRLARRPEAWINRPLRVRATARACSAWLGPAHASPCLDQQVMLADPAAGVEPLPVALGGAPRLVAFLRRLPLLRLAAPAPQHLRWETPTVYRIQLHSVPCGSSLPSRCYEALLLDAAP